MSSVSIARRQRCATTASRGRSTSPGCTRASPRPARRTAGASVRSRAWSWTCSTPGGGSPAPGSIRCRRGRSGRSRLWSAICGRCPARVSPLCRWSYTSSAGSRTRCRPHAPETMEGWMAGVFRFLFALLLGFVLGVGGTMYLIQSGAGDFVIKRTEAVQDLEKRLREVELQRDQLGRQLDDVVARSSRMETSFSELERRFHDLQKDLDTAHAGH